MPDLSEEQTISWLIQEYARRLPYYQLFRNYYDGNHLVIAVNDKYQEWFAQLLKALRLNLCETVVDALIDRLEITSWHPTVEEGEDSSVTQKAVEQAWVNSAGPTIMNEVHESASVEGDSYVLVWPDATGTLRMWPHRGDEMLVYYPAELPDLPYMAIKLWQIVSDKDKKSWRLNVYTDTQVLRYRSKSAVEGAGGLPSDKIDNWEELDGDLGPFTIPNPIGTVPVAHFSPSRYTNGLGRSDLRNAVPVQDALNKALVDLVVSGEGLSLPLRVMTGMQEMPDPETGKPTGPKYDPRTDTWMNIANEQAKLWTSAGADLTKMVDGVEHHIVNMARVTHTPPERLLARGGGVQSGVSRKVSEAPLVSKATTRRQRYTPAWERAMELVGAPSAPVWGPVTFETEEEKLEAAKAKVEIGIPLKQILLELGYKEDTITKMFAEQTNLDQAVGQKLTDAFRSGKDPAAVLNDE